MAQPRVGSGTAKAWTPDSVASLAPCHGHPAGSDLGRRSAGCLEGLGSRNVRGRSCRCELCSGASSGPLRIKRGRRPAQVSLSALSDRTHAQDLLAGGSQPLRKAGLQAGEVSWLSAPQSRGRQSSVQTETNMRLRCTRPAQGAHGEQVLTGQGGRRAGPRGRLLLPADATA